MTIGAAMDLDEVLSPEESVAAMRLTKDLRDAARLLSPEQQRIMVDLYYQVQESRKRTANQVRAAQQEPNAWITFMAQFLQRLEKLTAGALDIASNEQAVLRWAKSQVGVGPVLASALAAYIDITKTPSVAGLWRLAGQDATRTWNGTEHVREVLRMARQAEASDWAAFLWVCKSFSVKPGAILMQAGLIEEMIPLEVARAFFEKVGGDPASVGMVERVGENFFLCGNLDPGAVVECYQMAYPDVEFAGSWDAITKALSRRPWNAHLKVVSWKLGDSFCKFHNHKDCTYGHVYAKRKLLEVERNDAGKFADQAAATLATRQIRDKETRARYLAGKLPDGRLELRARRVAVKLFLSHYWMVAYWEHYHKLPPKPYILVKQPELHTQFVPPSGYEEIFVWD